MTTHPSRGRVDLAPLDTDEHLAKARSGSAAPPPATWRAVADVPGKGEEGGWLVEGEGGLAIWSISGALVPVDQRKAGSALAALRRAEAAPVRDEEAERVELADLCKRWRRGGKDDGPYLFDAGRAAAMLGMSRRTYEGIEQGRGFRYPRLLVLAIEAFGPDAP